MIAQAESFGVSIAMKSAGVHIPEIGIASAILEEPYDVHFGLNNRNFDKSTTERALHSLGPRILDIKNRGGITSEHTWHQLVEIIESDDWDWDKEPDHDLKKFSTEWNSSKMLGATRKDGTSKAVYPSGAKMLKQNAVTLVGGLPKGYNISLKQCRRCKWRGREEELSPETIKTEIKRKDGTIILVPMPTGKRLCPKCTSADLEDSGSQNKFECAGLQYGTRFSKAAIEFVAQRKRGGIHFHLDGLGDISTILGKTSDASYNVTSRELRYVWRNWERLKSFVYFYNGYTTDQKVVLVEKPWD